MFIGTTVISSENKKPQIKNAALLTVKQGGTHSYRWA
jgi:hypothetical protein